jgi:glycosyltransferase involved in cell wall biosynthesis
MDEKGKLLLICPQCDGDDVGEAWCGFNWASELSRRYDVTMLTQQFPGRRPVAEQIPLARVVSWPAFPYVARFPRFNRAIKPWYPLFYTRVRRWLRQMKRNGERFDLVHQFTPIAMRYPSPCAGLGLRYIVGPVAGALSTPGGFAAELGTQPAFMKLRDLDGFRLRHDPMLRRTYEDAEAVICSAPYVVEQLSAFRLKRTLVETEVTVDSVPAALERGSASKGVLKLLFVGRIIRTKGLRDAVRAMALLPDLPDVSLDVAGAGEDLEACRRECAENGLDGRIRFLGRQSPAQVAELYRQADVFLFPSFREATGIVLFEAMSAGLPIIAADAGGPGNIVSAGSGILVAPTAPQEFVAGLAAAVRKLALDPDLRLAMSKQALIRVTELGLWEHKMERIAALYRDVSRVARV